MTNEMESTSFTPSLAQNIRENSLVSLGALVGVPLVLFVRRTILSASRSPMSIRAMVIIGLCAGLAVFLFYICRFLWKAPQSVEISDRGVTVKFRGDRREEMAWEEISAASLTSDAGLNWKLRGANSTLSFRDDGFSAREWGRISRAIAERVRSKGIEIAADGLGMQFLS